MTESLTVLQMVHDLKSPLTALKILEATAELAPEHKNVLSLARSFLEAMVGQAKKDKEALLTGTQLAEIVLQVVEEKAYIHGFHAITVDINAGAEDFFCSGDAFELRRVLANLIENAAHANWVHGSAHPVKVSIDFRSQQAVIVCRDYGSGVIGCDKKANSSWGLGLRIVRDICAKHDWEFSLFAEVDKGARARLSLPRRRY